MDTHEVQPYEYRVKASQALRIPFELGCKCERWRAQSTVQALKPQVGYVFSTALPMISRGFCLFFRSESRYKVGLGRINHAQHLKMRLGKVRFCRVPAKLRCLSSGPIRVRLQHS